MELIEITDRKAWDRFVALQSDERPNPHGHPLQLWGWGEAKRDNGWVAHRLVLADGDRWLGGVQVLVWTIPRVGRKIAYVPRGPVVTPGSVEARQLLTALVAWAKARRMLYVRIEPAWTEQDLNSSVGAALGPGWVRSKHSIQLAQTYTVNLVPFEDEILAQMARKHRQYIRKAERDGVTVQRVTDGDLGPMYDLYVQTAQRAGFGIHAEEYYAKLQQELGPHSYLYYARYNGQVVAFLWLAAVGYTAYELYGGVSEAGQEIKANYVLKWTAMMELKAEDFRIYDFNGRLNEGVSRFKEGFGPAETDYIGTWDFAVSRLGYRLWEGLWPVAKVVGRRLARLKPASLRRPARTL